ncbi:SIP domain-containing protein [Mucilaginibacter rubeus]|uniref:SIP domain-containing protein n=1 Tax=Mucilaginibacter rubeus TaxID=2027860 RepID=UPI00166D9913|nr:SIP domain-containing protein [Mucilaginibacter rubeus]
METSTLHKLKRKAGSLFENQLLQSGRVLEVRHWEPSTMIEIDLHLPQADMQNWHEIPYIKIKVDNLTYRDYTPAGWDAETSTCTLYIDAAHSGPGSKWAKQLQKNDTVRYLKIRSTRHAPAGTPAIIGLGDESSMGHMLALQQMVLPATRFSGAIVMADENHRGLFSEYFKSPLKPIERNDVYGHHSLIQWVMEQQYNLEHSVFYIAGNHTMVGELRKLLKLQGYPSSQIRIQGFWS